MVDERDYYQETIARLEPDITPIDMYPALASIAISLKRLADVFEPMVRNPSGQVLDIESIAWRAGMAFQKGIQDGGGRR